ncbi:helix-turn-helix transcriptional regulator [bacterium]|nr:helix-turn-helix transcriptional regulator [bacterium]
MKDIELRCNETTKHISDKILLLRRANKLTQEEFAEKVSLDRRTIARAEAGKHRPSAETMEMIAQAFNIPISYFFDSSTFKTDISKTALIYEINTRLNVLSKNNLKKVKSFIDIIE